MKSESQKGNDVSLAIALALGNFDGVHRGHQAMLRRVVEAADELGLVPAVVTFDPTPRDFFMATTAVPERLLSLDDRLKQMSEIGISEVHLLSFDKQLADMGAEAFAGDFLEKQLNVRWLLATRDMRFGKDREGDLDFLRSRSNKFMLETLETISIDDEKISSTAVRKALMTSDFTRAELLLGRPYKITGRIRSGEARGRTIGFPTVNLPLSFLPPISGVFAVRVHGIGKVRDGVANLGVRPTVVKPLTKGLLPTLEAHIFDFQQDIYGQRIEVEFVEKLRDEKQFDGMTSLKKQIEDDARRARGILSRIKT